MESGSRVKTFVLPYKCFDKGVGCTWRRGNQFGIYSRSQKLSNIPNPSFSDCIMNVRQDVMLFTSALRKFVNESNGPFIALQKTAELGKNSDNQMELLKLSRVYRSIIRVSIENLQKEASKVSDGLEKNTLSAFITIFYSIECVWHMCEILYIDNIPGDVVLPYLLEWVRFHFPCYEEVAEHILEACEQGSEVNPAYWDTVVGMVVQGRLDVVRALLKLHSARESNEFKLVDNALKTMPVYSMHSQAYGGVSSGEFIIGWKHWQADCRAQIANRLFSSQPQLELVMKLIIGDYAAFKSIRNKYDSWLDLLGGWVMYSSPCARRHELAKETAACASLGGAPGSSQLESMVRAVIDGELHQVIRDIQQVSDNGWFATHLTDMLFHCGKLKIVDNHHNNVTEALRNSLIFEYGALLMEHKSLWVIGLSYLGINPEGLRIAELLLERVPFETEAKALRIIAEARKYGLLGVVQTVSCAMSARRVSAPGGVGGALAWGVRARSAAACGRAAERALRGYQRGEGLPATDLLLSAGPSMLLHPRLLFLAKYCEFHRMFKEKEFRVAAELLMSLITSDLAPDYFWEILLVDVTPMLESDEPLFSSTQTYDIMLCVNLKVKGFSGVKADTLRYALARNLSRTVLVAEGEDKKS